MSIYHDLHDFIENNSDYKDWKYLAFSAKKGFELTDTKSPVYDLHTEIHRYDDHDDKSFIEAFSDEVESLS